MDNVRKKRPYIIRITQKVAEAQKVLEEDLQLFLKDNDNILDEEDKNLIKYKLNKEGLYSALLFVSKLKFQ